VDRLQSAAVTTPSSRTKTAVGLSDDFETALVGLQIDSEFETVIQREFICHINETTNTCTNSNNGSLPLPERKNHRAMMIINNDD